MRWLLLVIVAACAAPVDPDRPAIYGRLSDPAFCVNVEADGIKYTADDAQPSASQAMAGVKQGRYPYPATCVALP
jgi:hypothetical protein